jgi:hypothetical protein
LLSKLPQVLGPLVYPPGAGKPTRTSLSPQGYGQLRRRARGQGERRADRDGRRGGVAGPVRDVARRGRRGAGRPDDHLQDRRRRRAPRVARRRRRRRGGRVGAHQHDRAALAARSSLAVKGVWDEVWAAAARARARRRWGARGGRAPRARPRAASHSAAAAAAAVRGASAAADGGAVGQPRRRSRHGIGGSGARAQRAEE